MSDIEQMIDEIICEARECEASGEWGGLSHDKLLVEAKKKLIDYCMEQKKRIAELEIIEQKAIEQSEYIQSEGLSPLEAKGLRGTISTLTKKIAELERQLSVAVKISAGDKVEFDYAVLDRIAELETENKKLWTDAERSHIECETLTANNVRLREENDELEKSISILTFGFEECAFCGGMIGKNGAAFVNGTVLHKDCKPFWDAQNKEKVNNDR
jgi:hypothetical protein